MAIKLIQVGNAINAPVNQYSCDTLTDMNSLNVTYVPFGSTCYVINDGSTYVLNSDKTWKLKTSGGVSGEVSFKFDVIDGGTANG